MNRISLPFPADNAPYVPIGDMERKSTSERASLELAGLTNMDSCSGRSKIGQVEVEVAANLLCHVPFINRSCTSKIAPNT